MTDGTMTSGGTAGALSGRSGWLICDGKAGMVVQVRGVADALGLDYEMKTVAPRGLHRILSPWGPVHPSERAGAPGSPLTPPWPEIVIATGRASIPYLREVRRHADPSCFTVVLQDPKTPASTADLIWVPQHDRRRGDNVITTLTSPHSFSAERIEDLRQVKPEDIRKLSRPRVCVVLGGKNSAYKFREDDDRRLEQALASVRDFGASFMITTSRRTHQRLLQAVERGTAGANRIIWTGEGDNPYPQFLAHAEWLIVTADSVNMTGEACATGRPIYVFFPSGGSAKFGRFHEALEAYGATRRLPDRLTALERWNYEPLFSAQIIAGEIERRWQRHLKVVTGLVQR